MSYTLVQHSGFGYARDSQFARAVELRSCNAAEARRVKKAGGVLVRTYQQASELEYSINYPPDLRGMIPRCRGTFSKYSVDGLHIYTPIHDEVGDILAAESAELLAALPGLEANDGR